MASSIAATMHSKPMDLVNPKISSILRQPLKITKELQEILNTAADSYKRKSYKIAANYFKNALEWIVNEKKTVDRQTVILIKYMLCACWLESTEAKDLSDALKILEELEKEHGSSYPMLYYAIGRAYFKLYRFNKADETLKRGFAAFRNDEIKFDSYCIPGNNEIIPESSRIGLVASLSNLKDQCSSWRRPDAVCCFVDCSTIGHNEGADKNIFFGSPTFIGMAQVTCDSPSNVCIMCFHLACWKSKKELLSSTRKMSDKDVLQSECFTPNCVDGKGERCRIKKIEIFDDNAEVKATIEPRGDDAAWHPKTAQTPKGAIKKQHHQPKTKVVSSEPRAPIVRNPRPPTVPKEVPKFEEIEEEDDLHDEQALKWGIAKLKDLRSDNFGIKNDEIWRPDLSMYGSEFMLATAEVLPDPDFSDDSPENDETKSFIFSYFYALISMNGPMKLSNLEEKWKEAQEVVIEKNCESILHNHVDIAEFLIQSLKFSIVNDYICTADKLPEAYDLAKADSCEILKFFMENDIDQNSTTSSVDDEAVFNDIINQEQNNNELPCSMTPSRDKKQNDEPYVSVSDALLNALKKDKKVFANGCDETKIIVPEEQEKLPEIRAIADVGSSKISDIDSIAISTAVNENKSVVNKPFFTIGNCSTPVKKNVQKRSHSPELSKNYALNGSTENNSFKIQKESPVQQIYQFKADNSPKYTINGIHTVTDIEKRSRFQQSIVEPEKFVKSTKSTGNLENQNSKIGIIRDSSINNSGEPDKHRPTKNATAIPLTSEIKEKMKKSADTDTNCNSLSKNNENNRFAELTDKMEKLNEELARSKDETEQLKKELAEVKKANELSRGIMLAKILRLQYAHQQSVINSKLDARRYDYNIILGIQQLLGSSIGQTLPISEPQFLKHIVEMERIAKNHKIKFATLNEQLCTSFETENPQDLELNEIPKLPKCNLLDAIRSAFGMLKMHHMKEFQRMQFMPLQQPPLPQLFGQTHYAQQQAFVHSMTTQQTFHHGPPLVTANPQHSRLPYHYGQQQQITKNSYQLNNNNLAHPSYFNPPAPRHNNATSLPYRPNNPSTATQPNFSFPVGKVEQKIETENTATKQIVLSPDLVNDEQSSASSSIRETNGENDAVPHSQDWWWSMNSQSDFIARMKENSLNHENRDYLEKIRKANEMGNEACGNSTDVPRKETKIQKKAGHSMDKLMRRLRSTYSGVLELDLLKSVECVRKKHNNSLSKLPMLRIVREAERFIGTCQQKQLCGYEKRQTNQSFTVLNTNPHYPPEGECKRQNSNSSSTSVISTKKETTGSSVSRKHWEPVSVPNDTWIKQTEETECIICFDVMLNAESLTLQCKHSFHKTCIKNWYKHQKVGEWVMGSCPMCRLHSTIDDEYPPLPLG